MSQKTRISFLISTVSAHKGRLPGEFFFFFDKENFELLKRQYTEGNIIYKQEKNNLYLDAFAKLRKATIRFVTSPSLLMEQLKEYLWNVIFE